MDLTRSGEVVREEVEPAATEVCRGSTLVGCRVDPLNLSFEPFLELFEDAAFEAFLFKLMGLGVTARRPDAFFACFDFGFAFVAINAATYTNSSS